MEIQDLYVGDKLLLRCSLLLRPLSKASDEDEGEGISQVLSFFLASAVICQSLATQMSFAAQKHSLWPHPPTPHCLFSSHLL